MTKLPEPKEILRYYGYEQKYLNRTDKTLINLDSYREKSQVGNELRAQLLSLRKEVTENSSHDNKEVYIFEATDGKIYAAMWKDLIFRLGSVDDVRNY